MSVMPFWTTPKGYLPNYSFIFRNMDPLGDELNNASCSRIGTVLYVDIQVGKEVMKVSDYQQDIGGTAACMKIITKTTEGCGQLA